jgi:prephenate dehydrogenase
LSAPLFPRVYLLGAGLIGGSLALDLRARGIAGRVEGHDADPAALAQALRLGLLAQAVPFEPSRLRGYDLVFLAVPVLELEKVLRAGGFAPGTLVTDAGSVKLPLAKAAAAALGRGEGWEFVPAHPIAGDEQSGPGAARTGLFAGARCVLTPAGTSSGAADSRVAGLWDAVGAQVETMTAEQHDDTFAWVSHLPHLAAYALVGSIIDHDPASLVWSGAGLLDTTRIAASSPRMWTEIALANRGRILAALAAHGRGLQGIAALLEAGDGEGLARLLSRAAEARRGMR